MYRNLAVLAFLALGRGKGENELGIWRDAGYEDSTILNSTAHNPHGTPFLSSIVQQLELACPKTVPFVAYVNADIMFDNDLQQTLQTLQEWTHNTKIKIMAVGRRSNHDLSGTLDLGRIKQVKSEMETDVAQDYFIMSRSLIKWDTLPNFVIGRRAYDNALLDWAHHNAVLVDATDTLLALHQTTADGNRAGHSAANVDREFNVELPNVRYDHGSTNNAHYKTAWLQGRVVITKSETNKQVWPLVETNEQVWPLAEIKQTDATSGTLFKMNRSIKTSEALLKPLMKQANSPFAFDSFPVGLRWVVITSIFPPTKLIQGLVQIKDWCTVVIADKKSLSEANYLKLLDTPPRCFVYLSVEKQLKLDYSITEHTPINSFGRKNIGFIFAVHHGAKVIYDTDDDNEIADEDMLQFWASLPFRDNSKSPTPYWQKTNANPYLAHGGVPGIWPRGLPLDQVKNKTSSDFSILTTPPPPPSQICIIQSLADREPDVDAIYRLTNPNYPAYFTPSTRYSASIAEQGQMPPFNAQATLFFEDAFDTMLLPVTVHGRVSDIWRGYMSQALIKPHCKLAFVAPWVTQVRNSHNYLADFDAEIPLYRQASAFVEHLKQASYNGISEAVVDAYEHELLGEADVRLAAAWQIDMRRAKLSAQALLQRDESGGGVPFRHLLILMGRGVHLKQWIEKITTGLLQHVDLVIGIFDHTVQSLECPNDSKRVTCVSVTGTTWTAGRNALAKVALSRERDLNRKYSFWTFADADVVLQCKPLDSNDCFSAYDTFLARLPVNVWVTALMQNENWPATQDTAMVELQAFDAAWNSIRREAVPIMLPYRSEEDANTWWSSQVIFWSRLQCLAPLYAVAPLFIFYENPEHGEYPRNTRNFANEQRITDHMMGRLSSVLAKPPTQYEGQFTADRTRPLPLPPMQGPFSETFQRCAAEVTSDFYSFVAIK